MVQKVRYLTRVTKVGHAGTLDPLATGLLIICTGKYTKQINTYMGMTKEYTGSMVIGATTPTYDLESEPENFKQINHITTDQIYAATKQFVGPILQMPPQHSAIKKDGKRLYEHARAGEEVEIASRKTTIYEFEITRIELPEIDFRIACSKGTYIRSIAFDFGIALNSGGHLTKLRRTKIGNYSVDDGVSPEKFEQ
jgi:tRNA pseudouridine55 synthase